MDYFFTNRKSDGELMTVLNFLDCDSECTFACAVDKGPGDFLVSATRTGLEFRAGRESCSARTASMLSLPEARRIAKQEWRRPPSRVCRITRQPAWVQLRLWNNTLTFSTSFVSFAFRLQEPLILLRGHFPIVVCKD